MVTRMLSRMVAGGSEADSGVGATGTDGAGAALVVAPTIGPLRDSIAGFAVVAGEVVEFCAAMTGAIVGVELFLAMAGEFVSAELSIGPDELK